MCKKLLLLVALATITTQTAFGEIFGGVEFPSGVTSFADDWVSYDPLPPADGLNPDFQRPQEALGPPSEDFVCDGTPPPECEHVTLGNGGSLVVQFTDNYLTGSGDASIDLWIFEVGPEVEDCTIEISKDGITWESVGNIAGATAGIDIDQYGFDQTDQFSFVRITDIAEKDRSTTEWAGADIDAVGAISSTPAEPELPPVADAGLDQANPLGVEVQLDGSGSYDPDNNLPLSYHWGFVSMPEGSTATISDPTAVNPTFTPDLCGIYTLVLVVTDDNGNVSLTGDTVEIEATSSQVSGLMDVIDFGDTNSHPRGTILTSINGAGGTGPVAVSAFGTLGPTTNAAVIFDSSSPSGGAKKLGTPNETIPAAETLPPFLASQPGEGAGGEYGSPYENYRALENIMIIAATLLDADSDGLVDIPRPQGGDAYMEFDFSSIAPVTVYSMDVIDIHPGYNATITHFDANGNQLSSFDTPPVGVNGVAYDFPIQQSGVYKTVVNLDCYVAVDNIRFKEEGATNECSETTVVVDTDQDGHTDILDNCPNTYNPTQANSDGVGEGDACAPDPTPTPTPEATPTPDPTPTATPDPNEPPPPGAGCIYSKDANPDTLLLALLACGLFYGISRRRKYTSY